MKYLKKTILSIACSVLAVGCATHPDKITASSVSPIAYQDYSCKQISQEISRVEREAAQLYGQLDKTASDDSAQMAVGMVLFWPALFFLEGGDGPQAAEYARLKGEKEALESVSIKKSCN